DLKYLLLLEQVANLEAGKDGRGRAPNVARFEPDFSGRREVYLDLHLRCHDFAINARIDDAWDPRKDLGHLLRLVSQDLPLGSLHPTHDGCTCSCQYGLHSVTEISLNIAIDAWIFLHSLAYSLERALVIGFGIDAGPKLCGLHVDHLISRLGTSDMGGDV